MTGFHRTLVTSLLLGLAASSARGGSMSPERQREVLRGSINAFDYAVAVTVSHPDQASELYRQAVGGFTALAEAGVHNAAVEYNLGNAYFRLGDVGRAILHYRRATRFAPLDADLRANLDYARRQVEPQIERAGEQRIWRSLAFWHFDTSQYHRFLAAAILSCIGWLLLLIRLRWRARTLTVAALIAITASVAAGTSVYWQWRSDKLTPPAVVVGNPVVLRLGRGEAYDPALAQPLGPGVELRIVELRGDWAQIRLMNDQTGWLPAAAVEAI